MNAIVFIDTEINPQNDTILDMGAIKPDGSKFHSSSQSDFSKFISDSDFICGHNIIVHDLKYIPHLLSGKENILIIDTLCLSPLLFPNKPYHALLKDDKFQSEDLNNPLNDSIKSMELFFDEVNAFEELNSKRKDIYFLLLHQEKEFSSFFKYMKFQTNVIQDNKEVCHLSLADAQPPENYEDFASITQCQSLIKDEFFTKICEEVDMLNIIQNNPIELAYCLALISADNKYSIIPPWVHKSYPIVESIMKLLRSSPCKKGCSYCGKSLDVSIKLKTIFGYDEFRKYNGEPLQKRAANAAVHNRSLLAIFPTGGGKSITFQLPALISGEATRGLTVVISPLQSLMKDQVDNLSALGVVDAVTINGLLSPIERAEAFARVESGLATILYISPELLRSRTIEKLLQSRNVVRFVIDEAHCFSAWGQDFRVDYLYIGDFIKELKKTKGIIGDIPVSCFTATAKQKVISDIKDYFKQKLNIELELYATDAARSNLRYGVLHTENDNDKYIALRNLIAQRNCSTIVYVSRVKRTFSIANQLTEDGFLAYPFNGQMESSEKIITQEAFIAGDVKIIVATSAFGMGVDKKDVGLVIHFDISSSLENYVQEAGRAGRDQTFQAECYVLFNDNDLDKHFIFLNQTKLSISEIQQIWSAIKDLTKNRKDIYCSPLEIARQAGWSDRVSDVETRVKTAISALETASYIKRGKNFPRVYATSILVKNMEEASYRINNSNRFSPTQKQYARSIMQRLLSSRSISKALNDEAESRIDYISDLLGISREDVITCVNLMREDGLLADTKDLTAYIRRTDNQNKSLAILERYYQLEEFLISILREKEHCVDLKDINDKAEKLNIKGASIKSIRTLLYYWTIKGYMRKSLSTLSQFVNIILEIDRDMLKSKHDKRIHTCRVIVNYLYEKSREQPISTREEVLVLFSVLELKNACNNEISLFKITETTFEEVEDALLFLSKINSLSLEGGFLVIYNAMQIHRLELDNRIRYKNDDYKQLNEFYKQKTQQIHIVGEYANMMVRDYDEALVFVNDYFQMNYKQFIAKYFKGNRAGEINRNITPEKYKQLFGGLSNAQLEIVNDETSKYIVVAAGPGSGKTRLLVHKIASLFQLEDVKHEQLLMLTFSRAATMEFKKRLVALIGNAANFIEIKTFHSYCFDLLGKVGNLERLDEIIANATNMINSGEVEAERITKTVLVIDEAQDINEGAYGLIKALMSKNEGMRMIAVGDDDQGIYEFEGASSKYLKSFIAEDNAQKYELLENYRSKCNIVQFANIFAATISQRLKEQPNQPVQYEKGVIHLIKHMGRNMEIPIVNNIKATYKTGTVCVLTNTNYDAVKVMGLLIKEGLKAKLIQNSSGINLYNLAEFRYFIKMTNKESQSPVISNEVWKKSRTHLQTAYKSSKCLNLCLELIDRFEQTNKNKYKSDLEIFLRESTFDDFYNIQQDEIVVSTIHKAKGREFDNVYILMNKANYDTDENRREIYVGLTRAKNELYIHYNDNFFDKFSLEGIQKSNDYTKYPEPDEIIMQLSYKDIFLSFVKDKKRLILGIQSGFDLIVKNNSLFYKSEKDLFEVLQFSKEYKKKMNTLQNKGYVVDKAKVRFVVAWKGKDDEQESALILPDLYYKKSNSALC